ncbi:MAG TPA: hypothetical protein VHB72_03040 [Candidatus Saccharimonadales bacterium]|nr:hypothetical protein [Candidatus Saccharimonadales bacterium]
MEPRTVNNHFNVELMKRGSIGPVRGFRLPVNIASLDEIERVTELQPIPYAGDEQPIIYVRRVINKFMLEKPA